MEKKKEPIKEPIDEMNERMKALSDYAKEYAEPYEANNPEIGGHMEKFWALMGMLSIEVAQLDYAIKKEQYARGER